MPDDDSSSVRMPVASCLLCSCAGCAEPRPTGYDGGILYTENMDLSSRVALVCALVICLLPSIAVRLLHPIPKFDFDDFMVYYLGASLVEHGQSHELYSAVEQGQDPQHQLAPVGSAMYKAAVEHGAHQTMLYLYPPTLADMLMPLTNLPLRTAMRVWLSLNICFAAGALASLVFLFEIPWFDRRTLLIAVATFCFFPVVYSLVQGQITVFLLFLWAAATMLYAKGSAKLSAVLFGVAALIKLTPLLIVFPFLIWRQWRWLSTFVLTLVGLAAASAWLAPGATSAYFLHVVPAMSRGIPAIQNFSLSASIQLVLNALAGRSENALMGVPGPVSATFIATGKMISYSGLLIVCALLIRARHQLDARERVVQISLLALVSAVLAPVSWMYSYAPTLLTFAVLWTEALKQSPA